MIVVADTSPLNYLILIEEIDILTRMYGRVVIPHTVRNELLRPSAPLASDASLFFACSFGWLFVIDSKQVSLEPSKTAEEESSNSSR